VELKDIRKIVEMMKEHELSHFHFEKEDFVLELKKGVDADALGKVMSSLPVAAPAPVAAAAAPASAPVAAPTTTAAAPASAGETIDSPMVGTFYQKPSPESPNFVSVGDSVSEGQTLCIIEAMKVMNEIKAEKSGVIAEVLVADSEPVQFGDALFRLK